MILPILRPYSGQLLQASPYFRPDTNNTENPHLPVQWIPGDCEISDNELSDITAKSYIDPKEAFCKVSACT